MSASPSYITASVILHRGADMVTFSRAMTNTGSSGTGMPHRIVETGSRVWSNRVQYFYLTADEMGALSSSHSEVMNVVPAIDRENSKYIVTKEHFTRPIKLGFGPITGAYGAYDITGSHWFFESGAWSCSGDPLENFELDPACGRIPERIFLTDAFSNFRYNPYFKEPPAHRTRSYDATEQVTWNGANIYNNSTFPGSESVSYGWTESGVRILSRPMGTTTALMEDFELKGHAAKTANFGLWLHTDKSDQIYSGSGPLQFGGETVLRYMGGWAQGRCGYFPPVGGGYNLAATQCEETASNLSFGSANWYAFNSGHSYPTSPLSSSIQSNSISTSIQFHHDDNLWDLYPQNSYMSGGNTSRLDRPIPPFGSHHIGRPHFINTGSKTEPFYSYHLTGKDVDYVNLEKIHRHYAGYYSPKGIHRHKAIDFPSHLQWDDMWSNYPNAAERNYNLENYWMAWSSHGDMTTDVAGGLLSWGKETNLYSVTLYGSYTTMYDSLEGIIRFHESKSIEPGTGFKKPTVVNESMGLGSQLIKYPQSGSIATGSFEYPESSQGDLKGIRISYLNKDYCFISSSTNGTPLQTTVCDVNPEARQEHIATGSLNANDGTQFIWYQDCNGVHGNLDFAVNGKTHASNFYYYTGGPGNVGIVGLVDAINKVAACPREKLTPEGNPVLSGSTLWSWWGYKGMFHVTASYSASTLILSGGMCDGAPEGRNRGTFGEFKIYTGSYQQFLGLEASPCSIATGRYYHRIKMDFTPQTPYGGQHVLTLKSDITASSGFKYIHYRGNTNFNITASNNQHHNISTEVWPQARYGFPRYPNHDHFGIDNGWNLLGPAMRDPWNQTPFNTDTPGSHGSGTDPNRFQGGYSRTEHFHPTDETNTALKTEAAAAGVVWITSNGNSGGILACAGSGSYSEGAPITAEDAPFFDGDANGSGLAETSFMYKENSSTIWSLYGEPGNFSNYAINPGVSVPAYPNRAQNYNGSVIGAGGLVSAVHAGGGGTTTNHGQFNRPWFPTGKFPSHHVVADASGHGYVNTGLGYGLVYPSLIPQIEYDCGPVTDVYTVSDGVRGGNMTGGSHTPGGRVYTQNNQYSQTSYGYGSATTSASVNQNMTINRAHTHSIYEEIDKKHGIKFLEANISFSASWPNQANTHDIGPDGNFEQGYYQSSQYGGGNSAFLNPPIIYEHNAQYLGGTSTASPQLVGLVSLYLQVNPGANVTDVRKFLRYNGRAVMPNDGNSKSEPIFRNILRSPLFTGSSFDNWQYGNPQYNDPRLVNIADGAISGAVRLCTGDTHHRIAHIPFTSGFKNIFSGSINWTKK